ncbi:hypothetical protein [Parasitella parasitica]|uniref:Uncharacterized protein n=1 Tax=Parasitella parasitica TaxID=35722 RepID=A0A0B7NLN2_9FUNG|nr:hypothetical protein [Parasitella parasitica]
MDILRDYVTEKQKKKLVISTFFKKERSKIETYHNNLNVENKALDLKIYWSNQIEEFAKEYPDIQVVKDYYLIDFVEFEIARKSHLLVNQVKINALNRSMGIIDDALEQEEGKILPLSSTTVFNKLENKRIKLTHQEDIQKQENFDYGQEYTEGNEGLNTQKLKKILKDAKVLAREGNTGKRKVTKKIIKICKIYRDMLETDNENKFSGHMNEVEYTHQFLFPLIKEVLYDCLIKFKLGEPHLQCAAANTNDDERTQSGPKIDIILLHQVYQFAISICEISGPNHKANKNHFLGDRNKLAKNMRHILNHIEDASPTPNATSFKKVKIYGLQVYLNVIYLYSLTRASEGYSVFLLEKTLTIPTSLSLLQMQLPAFLGWLWNLNFIYNQMITDINSFIETSNDEDVLQIDSQPSSTASSQESNPSKRQKN